MLHRRQYNCQSTIRVSEIVPEITHRPKTNIRLRFRGVAVNRVVAKCRFPAERLEAQAEPPELLSIYINTEQNNWTDILKVRCSKGADFTL